MTVLPELEKQLVRAASTLGPPRRRSGRLVGWGTVAASALTVAGVAIGILVIGGRSADRLVSAKGGLAAPPIARGQAWYTRELAVHTALWPPVTPQLPGQPFRKQGAPRAVIQNTSRVESWVYDGGKTTVSHVAIPTRYYGNRRDRAHLLAMRQLRVGDRDSGGSDIQPGYSIAETSLSYQQVQDFPADPDHIVKFLQRARVPVELPWLVTLLEQIPFKATVREAVLRTAAQLPNVHNLGKVRDPLGRTGTALGIDTQVPPKFSYAAPPQLRWSYRTELIYDPSTAALLASETVLLSRTQIPGVGPGFALNWTAYEQSHAVAKPPVAKPRHASVLAQSVDPRLVAAYAIFRRPHRPDDTPPKGFTGIFAGTHGANPALARRAGVVYIIPGQDFACEAYGGGQCGTIASFLHPVFAVQKLGTDPAGVIEINGVAPDNITNLEITVRRAPTIRASVRDNGFHFAMRGAPTSITFIGPHVRDHHHIAASALSPP